MLILKLKNSHKRESIEILVNSLFKYFLFLILLNNCSLDTKSGIWTDKKDLIVEKDKVIQILTKDDRSDLIHVGKMWERNFLRINIKRRGGARHG